MKKIIKGLLLILSLVVSFFICKEADVKAFASNQNINVTVPATMNITFEEDGSNSVSEFYLSNNSLVPIEIRNIIVTEYNGWKLVQEEYEILADKKELCLQMDGTTLMAGSNVSDILVEYGTEHRFHVETKRGAWSQTITAEKAFSIEFQYAIGTREFVVYLDGNEGVDDMKLAAENGTVISLPSPERAGYVFAGWQDEEGQIYQENYTVPIGDVRLSAQWIKADAYATYCEEDKSLNFYRSTEPIEVNTIYQGKLVAAVYTGFEDAIYDWGQTPWHSLRYKLERVEFHNIIQPVSLDYWFLEFNYANYGDMRKLDLSKVTSMKYMCNQFGVYADEVELIGLEDWDVSNVTNMSMAFSYVGTNAELRVAIGDLSNWNVGNVQNFSRTFSDSGTQSAEFHLFGLEKWNTQSATNMAGMFQRTGKKDSDWTLNLSNWNVLLVTRYSEFNLNVETKVIAPNWNN